MAQEITPNDHLPAATLIKQPVQQDLKTENGVMQLTEKWKGLYTHCQAVAKALYDAKTSDDDVVVYNDFITAAGTRKQEYPTPSAPTGMVWQFAQAVVDEIEAGENATLQVIWNAIIDQSGGGDPFPDWPVTETWSLQWQPENYDVYAYCKNPKDHQVNANNGSQRVAVENCLHPPVNQNIMTQQQMFAENDGVIVSLNDNEKKILGWKLEGMHVIKHHPMLQCTKVWTNIPKAQLNAFYSNAQGELHNPDYIENPSKTLGVEGYQWVCQGSNVDV